MSGRRGRRTNANQKHRQIERRGGGVQGRKKAAGRGGQVRVNDGSIGGVKKSKLVRGKAMAGQGKRRKGRGGEVLWCVQPVWST